MSTILTSAQMSPVSDGLALRNVIVKFGGNIALNDVSLKVDRGERVALIGPNGAGKSTLVNVITGILRPSAGEVTFDHKNLAPLSPLRRTRMGLSRTFQNLELFVSRSVYDNILTARDVSHPASRGSGNQRAVHEMVERVGLGDVSARPVHEISYGLRKLVEIARALVVEPRMLLLDEPVAGLNSTEKKTVSELLADVFANLSSGVLLIEHDMSTVEKLTDSVVVLDAGNVLTQGTFSEVTTHPLVVEAYLGRATKESSDR